MIGRRCAFVALGGLLVLVFTVNVYFIRMIVESSRQKSMSPDSLPVIEPKFSRDELVSKINENAHGIKMIPTQDMEEKIKAEMRMLPSKYFKQNSSYLALLDRLFAELKTMRNVRGNVWNIPNNWPDAHHLIPPAAPELGTILDAMRRAKIVKADNAGVGTQLKLMLILENGVKALFKPQWYTRETIIEGPVYRGKDRHNAEVVAFHLSSLLALRRVPLVVIRKLNLKQEVRRYATPALNSTMYREGNNTCFYGVCHYCTPADPVCARGDILEGALILWLPTYFKLVKHRHPWQRAYKKNKYAPWETDMTYCEKVKATKTYTPQMSSRLLDLIDTAVFDFLMDNGDRHHYELVQNNFHNPAVLLIDNGKSLGNPNMDHFDILAPLYQCCIIHKTTWDRLRLLAGGSLSLALEKLLIYESAMADVLPIASDSHLSAMDRRLLAVYAVVELCIQQKKQASSVILDHR